MDEEEMGSIHCVKSALLPGSQPEFAGSAAPSLSPQSAQLDRPSTKGKGESTRKERMEGECNGIE